jgi:Homing endonuclease
MTSAKMTSAEHALSHSRRVEDALINAASGNDVRALLASLSEEERVMYQDLAEQVLAGSMVDMEQLWLVDYERTPPTIEEFICDDYWLGETCRPEVDKGTGVFPIWVDKLRKNFDRESRVHNLVFTGSLGIGKCHRAGDRIIAGNGKLVRVEDVRVGDTLMGDAGDVKTVISVNQGEGEIFEIKPTRKGDTGSFFVNKDHILTVVDTHTGEVTDISVADYINSSATYKFHKKLFRAPIDFAPKRTTLDPRWFGMWLGDGSKHCPGITSMDTEIVQYHANYAAKFNLTMTVLSKGPDAKAKFYRPVRQLGQERENPIHALLRRHNLGDNQEKYIPDEYLYNSRAVRLELLAGIVDTDGGKYGTSEGCYSVGTKFENLAHQIAYLARSLGYYVRVTSRVHRIRRINFEGIYYSIKISGAHDIPCLLPRKLSAPRRQVKNHLRTGFDVIPRGRDRFYGFTLTGNGRYLTDQFIVTHNSFVSAIIFLYRIALIRLMREPQQFLGLSNGTSVYFVVLSVTQAVVQDTVFGDMQNFMSNSPFFVEECNYNPDLKYADMRVHLGKNIFLKAGSKGWHVIGRNAMGVLLDEGNWRIEGNPDMKAYRLYDEVRQRIKNRFQQSSGFLPAISMIASSARDESAFTERVIKEIEGADDGCQLVYREANYRVRFVQRKYCNISFRVAYGSKTFEPRILEGFYRGGIMPGDAPEVLPGNYNNFGQKVPGDVTHEDQPDGTKVEHVPVELVAEFRRSPVTALQGLSGISIGAGNRFLPNLRTYDGAIEAGMKLDPPLRNPCRMQLLPVSSEDDLEIWDLLTHRNFVARRASIFQPLYDPAAPRFAHVDLATSTVAGLAICHIAGREHVTGLTDGKGEPYSEFRVIVRFDLIMAITAGQTKPINFEKIQKFFMWLREACGFKFELVTADQYQSAMPMQMLESRKFNTGYLSVDRTKEPYLALRDALNEGRIELYDHPLLRDELDNLVENAGKIDHPDGKSKDVADAVAGAHYNALRTRSHGRTMGGQQGTVIDSRSMDRAQKPRPLIEIPKHDTSRPRPPVVFRA